MKLTCPECKNDVDLAAYPNLEVGQVVECDSCGMTLEVTDVEGNEAHAEVIEEGK